MVGRALILTVIGTFIISMMITRTISRSSNAQSDNVVRLFTRVTGRNLAQSGVNLALRTLASHPSRRTPASWTLSDGKVSVSLLDVHYRGRAAVQIVSTARVPYQSSMDAVFSRDTTFTTIAYLPKGFIPKWVKGVITTNNPVKIGGNVDVDGRDHDTTGAAIIASQGVFGVWTTSSFSQVGSSLVGGTNIRDTDYPLSKPADTSVVRANQPAGDYPGSPDSVLGGADAGFPEGTLKSIALSGYAGSQYTTDPATLHYPLSGVTYVELPTGGTWMSPNINGSGILIVHDSTKDAIMKNMSPSTFAGLLICDDISHINATFTIIGAVVGLTPDPSKTNEIGNGNSNILYSGAAIANAIATITGDLPVNTFSDKVLAWWE
jgi:hypothetical protein